MLTNKSNFNILVTGSTGLLGSSLVPYLSKIGYRIITQSRSIGADVIIDMTDYDNVSKKLNQINPNIIINLISHTSVEECEENPNLAYLANTKVVENIANWISINNTCHLIQISTDHLYDGIGPHIEKNVNLTNIYALTKYSAEIAASKVSSTILRTNFVGKSKTIKRESLSDWVYNSLTFRKKVQVLSDVLFSPLSIKSLIEIINKVIELRPIGVFNVGSNEGMSKSKFDFLLAKYLCLDSSNMEEIESNKATFLKAYRPKDMRLNNTKFELQLNIKLPKLKDEILIIANEYLNEIQ
jgi:dTDP-4-dehydrorhamnose reductase